MHRNGLDLINKVYSQHELVTSACMKVMEDLLLRQIYGLKDKV